MAMDTLTVKADYIARLQSILSDPFYKDATENSASYNTRLCMERKMRLPFLDAQTGVAQSDCSLWMQKWQRMPGQTEGQLYTYPARRWRKKKRQYLMNDFYLTRRIKDVELNETEGHQISIMENVAGRMDGEGGESNEKAADDSKDSWYQEFEENVVDIPPEVMGEVDDPESDVEEFEETYARKKKKKVRSTRGRKRADRFDYTDMEKPYSCEICGARYKTRPGLSYHYTHGHNNDSTDNTEEETNYIPPKPVPPVHQPPPPPPPPPPVLPQPIAQPTSSAFAWMTAPPEEPIQTRKPTSGSSPSPYCDFCLGDSNENKKTRMAEELVSCSDCGRSAHPTCLQFTPNMTLSVKKYRWQCIECKSCGICGTSDNDDQLLFCDDCDRGYHMYCLNPPLSEPPEGSWSCHLCIEEYGRK